MFQVRKKKAAQDTSRSILMSREIPKQMSAGSSWTGKELVVCTLKRSVCS
jgi:hypothetical protein